MGPLRGYRMFSIMGGEVSLNALNRHSHKGTAGLGFTVSEAVVPLGPLY